MSVISMKAVDPAKARRSMVGYDSARDALQAFLVGLGLGPGDKVMLPSFIGWSAREGSGVFDPIVQLKLEPIFYRMDSRLIVEIESFRTAVKTHRPKAVVVVHYFGYSHSASREAVNIAKKYGAAVLEDEAHGLFTDLVLGGSGRDGDAAIFSLHKMLPVAEGGILVLNHADGISICDQAAKLGEERIRTLAAYDLWTIAQLRRERAMILCELLRPLSDHMEPLWGGAWFT